MDLSIAMLVYQRVSGLPSGKLSQKTMVKTTSKISIESSWVNPRTFDWAMAASSQTVKLPEAIPYLDGLELWELPSSD